MDIKSMDFEELSCWVSDNKLPKFRAKQIYNWIHVKLVRDVEEMANIPKNIKTLINEQGILTVKERDRLISEVDGTNKFIFELYDGNIIESVFMKYGYGNSVCISSQAGCRMGCKFCASTLLGLSRNLEASEMLDQIYHIQNVTGERISNIVVMGTGEPLDNFDNLLKFIELITNEDGLNISQRNITVSSCGIVPKIYELADKNLAITFALSLHAPTDEERKELMPIAYKYTIKETIDACRYYFDKSGRRVTFEYSLVMGKNDSVEQAEKLAKLLSDINCHVNLIPINPIKERDFRKSDKKSIEKFKYILEKNRINGTIRRGMGSDIDAACGQLRKNYIKENVTGGQ